MHILTDLRIRLDNKVTRVDEQSTELNQLEQRIGTAILNQRDVFAQVLEGETSHVASLLEKLECSAQSRNLQSLAAIQSTQSGIVGEYSLSSLAQRQAHSDLDQRKIADWEKQRQKEWLRNSLPDLLTFPQRTDRLDDVSEAHRKTFRWIFENAPNGEVQWDNFVEWLKSGNGFYWINGKAGSGKSCLMKYIVNASRTSKTLSSWLPSKSHLITANFFLWNSGVQMQKSQIGLLQSILHDICEQDLALVERLFPDWFEYHLAKSEYKWLEAFRKILYYEESVRGEIAPPSQRAIVEAFKRLSPVEDEDCKICLFIDGIDELDGEISPLLEILFDVCGPNLKIVASSRPIPECIEAFEDSNKLRLQDLTKQDMKNYIDDVLGRRPRMKTLIKEDAEAVEFLKSEIVSRSSGVFLWTVLVVESLVSGLRNYDTMDELFLRLDELPRELEALYKHMLGTLVPFYREQASKLLQIAYASTLV
jgi:hypothetical protein